MLLSLPSILATTQPAFSQCTFQKFRGNAMWCTPCGGSALVVVLDGVPPFSYTWSTGETTYSISDLCPGTYGVTITDSLGCVMIDSVIIELMGTPMTISPTASAASCSTCCDVCIDLNLSGGCVPFSISIDPWDPFGMPCTYCPFQKYVITVLDACGCTVTDSITADSVAVGMGLADGLMQGIVVHLYPNPATTHLNITAPADATITIHNLQGQQLLTTEETSISVNHLSPGLYLLQACGEWGCATGKFIKQ